MADPLLGKLLWYELVTTDTKAAEAFYKQIVGWTIAPFPGAGDYDVLSNAAGTGMGGVMKMPDGMNYPPHWVMYIGTPNIDDTIAHIQRLGGRTLSPPIDNTEVGRMRTMLDPQGAMFSLIQPASPERSPDAPPEIGDASWRELYTSNAEAAMHFYSEVFGWQPTSEFDMGGDMGKYYMFGRLFPLGGMMTKTKEMAQVPTAWGIYFRVADVDAAATKVNANGGQVINGPMDVPGGDRVVMCVDPQGAAFNLHRPAAQPTA